MERLDYDPATNYRPRKRHDPWFGIEQEYFVVNEDGSPISYEKDKYNYDSLSNYLFLCFGKKSSCFPRIH